MRIRFAAKRLCSSVALVLLVLLNLFTLPACGVLEIGVEQTASVPPNPEPTATSTAAPTTTLTQSTRRAPAMMTPTPTPAPSGTLRVAFAREGNAWLWAEGGQARPLTDTDDVGESSVRLSDDGMIVAFARRSELWAINTDGTGERVLVSEADFDAMEPTDPGVSIYRYDWVPGTHMLAFNTILRKQFVTDPTDDLHLVDADTLEHTVLLPAGKGGQFHYSPDGSQIAIVRSGTIDLIDADGSNLRSGVFTYTPSQAYAEVRYYADLTWAADGSALGVTIPPPDPYTQPTQHTTVWHVPTDGRSGRFVASITAIPGSEPAFSSDLSYVAYLQQPGDAVTSDPSNLAITALGSVELSGGETVTYSTDVWRFAGWSPGASRFAFMSLTGVDSQPFQAEIGQLGYSPAPIENDTDAVILDIRWIDDTRLFALAKSVDEDIWFILMGEMGRLGTTIASIPQLPGDDMPSYDFADMPQEQAIVVAPTPAPEPTLTSRPRLSALHVAYIRDGDLWLWVGGPTLDSVGETEAVRLTTAGGATDVRISDDGQVVAFVRNGELWAVNTDGTNERKLVSIADLDAMEPIQQIGNPTILGRFEWVPGTHTVAFNTRLDLQIGLMLNDDLHLVEADTLEQAILLAPGEGGEFYYSPDGRQVAISKNGGISLVDADGKNRRDVLTYTPVATGSEYRFYAQPAWAADSGSLRVAIPPPDPFAQTPQPTSIWHLPTDGTTASLIGSMMARASSQPVFSHELRYVAYLEQERGARLEDSSGRLLITDLDTGETTSYYAQAYNAYKWSPDSQYLVFLTDPQSPHARIAQIGGDTVPLYDGEGVTVMDVHWVDETRYVFNAISPQGWRLFLGQVGGSSAVLAAVSGRSLPYDIAY